MPKDSKRVRRLRRLKRERTLAYRMLAIVINERDTYKRFIADIAKKQLRPDLEEPAK